MLDSIEKLLVLQERDRKLSKLKELGFDAMMFHDDDAVPDIDGKSAAQLRKESKELKKKLDDAGVVERPQGHLRSRLSDGLRRDRSHGFARSD